MLDTWLRRHGVRQGVELAWTTYEWGYIQAFGPRLDDLVADEFERRGIAGRRAEMVESVHPGHVRYTDGGTQPFDLLVSQLLAA